MIMPNIQVVEKSSHAKIAIDEFLRAGFNTDEIHLLTCNSANTINSYENELCSTNFVNPDTNILQVDEDVFFSKMQSFGISKRDAERYKESMDKGSIMVIVSKAV
ncbi:hypothetical protein FO516_15765 [Priestia megaterium]|jgi:Heat induced stress protein YflT